MSIDQEWVPQACSLPTRERPRRLAQFDDLFATALHGQRRLAPTRLRWRLDRSAEDAARELIARESDCCSFFTFALARVGGGVVEVDVQVSQSHVDVLDALVARAAARLPA
ncbi:hypothetical protein ACTMSW_11820 [Micromonospora sp. BQ11]|uniref:hypothetical protein n=1 Tax=Micromonospora sp. BQ11 TaxID=3452212 RepID=UPI003F89B32F